MEKSPSLCDHQKREKRAHKWNFISWKREAENCRDQQSRARVIAVDWNVSQRTQPTTRKCINFFLLPPRSSPTCSWSSFHHITFIFDEVSRIWDANSKTLTSGVFRSEEKRVQFFCWLLTLITARSSELSCRFVIKTFSLCRQNSSTLELRLSHTAQMSWAFEKRWWNDLMHMQQENFLAERVTSRGSKLTNFIYQWNISFYFLLFAIMVFVSHFSVWRTNNQRFLWRIGLDFM